MLWKTLKLIHSYWWDDKYTKYEYSLSTTYAIEKRVFYKSKREKWRKKGQYLLRVQMVIKWHMEVPKLGYYLSMWACLSRGYTKLGLLCRSKYSVWQNLKSNLVQTKAIAAATPSSNVHEIRQFLGLGNFFQTTVKNFAQIHNIISECAWGW
jgi:hypothetical protein